MSETDSFIEEVAEEVRKDRLWGYARRYGWIVLVIILLAVGGTAWNEWRKAQETAAAQALGDRISEALAIRAPAERAVRLAEIAPEAGRARVAVELNRAAAQLEAGDTEGAIATVEALAGSTDDPLHADLARIKAAMLKGITASPEERLAELEALAAPGAPFRVLALEQKAHALIAAGRKEEAVEVLNGLLNDAEATDGLITRASQLVIALGGEIDISPRLLSGQ